MGPNYHNGMPYTRPHNVTRRFQSIFPVHPPEHSTHFSLLIVVLVLLLSVFPSAQSTTVGSGSYTDTLPGGKTGPQSEIYVTDNLKLAPIPTTDWWSSVLAERLSHNHFAFPLCLCPYQSGLRIGQPSYSEAADVNWGAFANDLELRATVINTQTELSTNTIYASDFSDWSVTVEWNDSSSTPLDII